MSAFYIAFFTIAGVKERGDCMPNPIATVTIDTSQVQDDIKKLGNQLEELSNTVKRLNENGINIKLNIKLDSDTFFKRIFNK